MCLEPQRDRRDFYMLNRHLNHKIFQLSGFGHEMIVVNFYKS